MTPDHQQAVENTLQLTYARATELHNMLGIPLGKNPPRYTSAMMWESQLGRDLQAVANYIEGYPNQGEEITIILQRIARTLFGHTLSQTGFRLPWRFHKTPLGEMMFLAFERYFPATAWMTTAEVRKLFGVERQTVYDWAVEGRLAAYFVRGKQVYLRTQVEKFHAAWSQQKQQQEQPRHHKGIIEPL